MYVFAQYFYLKHTKLTKPILMNFVMEIAKFLGKCKLAQVTYHNI